MGLDGLRAFDALQPVPPAGPASRAFQEGGYAIMRNQWDDDANQMIVDIGPLGCPGSSGHGHADLLSVQCAIFGEPCLVDGGNFCYTPDSEWRDFFRSTASHSTLVIDGRTQSEPAGPFAWRERPRVRLREWHSSPELDFLDAEHDAFSRRGDPLVHRRRILFVKPRYWIIVDDLVGTLDAPGRSDVSVRAAAGDARPRSLGARRDPAGPRAVGQAVHIGGHPCANQTRIGGATADSRVGGSHLR